MKMNQEFDYLIFDSLIDKNINFALYCLPKENTVRFVMQLSDTPVKVPSIADLYNEEGFVVAPFHSSVKNPIVVIQPDIVLTGEEAIFNNNDIYNIPHNTSSIEKIVEQSEASSFDRYKRIHDVFIKALSEEQFDKLVLSRTFDYVRKKNFSVGATFKAACEKYPNSFVYLCNTSLSGAWFGISPELLISGNAGQYKTVALAGTKHISVKDWDDKNKYEQQIVVDYMKDQLSKGGCTYTMSDTFTIRTANIEHLKTEFSFNITKENQIGNLLELLHPTPAVCGYPKDKAFKFIIENEGYDRRYYSGFLGPLNLNKETYLYVNLRCMEIHNSNLCLYAGGGLLPSSDMMQEWNETENKLQTILSIIDSNTLLD